MAARLLRWPSLLSVVHVAMGSHGLGLELERREDEEATCEAADLGTGRCQETGSSSLLQTSGSYVSMRTSLQALTEENTRLQEASSAAAEASAEAAVAARAASEALKEAETAARMEKAAGKLTSDGASSVEVQSALEAAKRASAQAGVAVKAAADAKAALSLSSQLNATHASSPLAAVAPRHPGSKEKPHSPLEMFSPGLGLFQQQPGEPPIPSLWTKLPGGLHHLTQLTQLGGLHSVAAGSGSSAITMGCIVLLCIALTVFVGFYAMHGGFEKKDQEAVQRVSVVRGQTTTGPPTMGGSSPTGQAFPMPVPSTSATAGAALSARPSDAHAPQVYARTSLASFSGSQRGLPPAPVPAVPTPRPSIKLQGGNMGIQQPLCADLVVPQASECSLLVPGLFDKSKTSPSRSAHPDSIVLTVDDSRHTPVFRVAFSSSFRTSSAAADAGALPRCLTLSSANGEALFCLARESSASGRQGTRSLSICDHADKLYAELQLGETWGNGSICTLTTTQGHRTIFRRESGANGGSLNVTAEDGRLLAMIPAASAPLKPGEGRSVIIGPLVDAGLIVLCVLSMDWLHRDARGPVAAA